MGYRNALHFSGHHLEPLKKIHHIEVRRIYEDAVETTGPVYYSETQIQAWSALAWMPGVLDKPLDEGKGWISFEDKEIAAFALRYPSNRLALLYCRGSSRQKGHGTALLNRVEADAIAEGESSLITEASFFSYSLLVRNGWKLHVSEMIEIAGISFKRFCMEKYLY
tara:strand:- start:28 stop:525 length:498 start_codon:yes stop_codon:yes gene_type:complete